MIKLKMNRINHCHYLLLALLAPGLSSAFSMVHQGETQQVTMFTPPQKFNFFQHYDFAGVGGHGI